jgi:hypothetical protein
MQNSIFDRFGTKDVAERYVNALNEGCNLVIGACHEFAIVAKAFDGKKYNKRFIDAVNDALLARFGVHKFHGGHEAPKIKLWRDTFSAYNLHFSWVLAVRDVHLGVDPFTTTYFDKEIYGDIYLDLDENGRIDAKHFETNARIAAQRVEETQTRYADAIMFWDKYAEILDDIDEFIWNRIQGVNCLCVRSQTQYFNTCGSPAHHCKK